MVDLADQRNNFIDYLRGIAAIGIIAIHTAFWGGRSYTPEWFWNITLLLDVPFFFYLSGWASSYRNSDVIKTLKSLGRIWIKWIFFISVLTLFCWYSKLTPKTFQGIENFRDFCNNCFFNVSFKGFPVVAGSIWFMQYYFLVTFANTIVLMFIQKSSRSAKLKEVYMWLLLIGFMWVNYGKYLFGMNDLYILFYGFFWMMGFNRVGSVKSKIGFILVLILCAMGYIVTSYMQALPIYDIQSAKFPPSLKYGFASLFAIIIIKHLEEPEFHFNCFINHIGRNAIFYYFAQGIGSSLNYYVVAMIGISNWFVKWCITFTVNVFITVCIAELLRQLYIQLIHLYSCCIQLIKRR